MDNSGRSKILASVAAEDFVGRRDEADELWRIAGDEGEPQGILLLGAPGAGASELLRQIYDRLFNDAKNVIPFYFAFSNNDKTVRQAAARFLRAFLQQTIAFRRQNARLLSLAPDVCEISELAEPNDAAWIQQLISTCEIETDLADEESFIRTALAAPLRAAANNARVFVMLDDLHEAETASGGVGLIEELKDIYSHAGISFVFAGRRRFVLNATQTGSARLSNAKVVRLAELSNGDAELLVERLSVNYTVKINEQARDLIVRQLRGSPSLITGLFDAARSGGNNLDSFFQVEKAATDALLSGNFGRYYDRLFSQIAPNPQTQKQIVRLLREAGETVERKAPIELWNERVEQSFEEVYRIIRLLHIHEIATVNGGSVEAAAEENALLHDYLEARFRLEILSETRALVVSEALSSALKRAPQIMTRFYRRQSAINLKALLSIFNCQQTPAVLFDYAAFKARYKGAEDAEMRAALEQENEKINLPQIIYTAHTVAFYPPLAALTDVPERSAVALGFEAADYREETELVWIAAQIDSKLEAARDLVEFWCDRLEMVALMCNFPRYRLWLITPEGFSEEALEVLKQRGAYGSSRRQVESLIAYLNAENVIKEPPSANEYEIIVPMGDDTEMIAAHAVEEIARRHAFKPAAINQIKTALVEACINAAEHSHSPDRRIYQKFTVEDDKIVITVANRGVKMPSEKAPESISAAEPTTGRRGWGLKLMRKLMDEVNFEQTDDGTRISMVKFRK
jgi:serine/threonine-protein kinase RsbW